jgi:hypothetical protein
MEASRVSEASGSVEGRGRLVVASLAGPAFGSKRHLQRAQGALCRVPALLRQTPRRRRNGAAREACVVRVGGR